MTRKDGEHLRTTYGNTGQLFRPYKVSSAVYAVISPLEIEPSTTKCRAETLPLSSQYTSHTNDATSTSHGNCAAISPECILQVTSVLFTEDTVTSMATSSQEDRRYASV